MLYLLYDNQNQVSENLNSKLRFELTTGVLRGLSLDDCTTRAVTKTVVECGAGSRDQKLTRRFISVSNMR